MPGSMRIPGSLRALFDRRRTERISTEVANDSEAIDFVVVTDISTDGAKLVAPVPLSVGRKVSLKLPLLEPLEGTIVWVSSRLAGCRFLAPLHPALLRVIVAAAQDQRAQRQAG
nr:PilZ domain-containing protein [uncultured Sphingosinicella sp.]